MIGATLAIRFRRNAGMPRWEVNYNCRLAWIHDSIVEVDGGWDVGVAANIPPPPRSASSAAAVAPTKTPVPALPNDGRRSFAGTEPRVPDPVGLAV